MNRRPQRLAKLEEALSPKQGYPRYLITFAHNGVRDESDETAIARHLEEQPEDVGLKFKMMVINCVTPTFMAEKAKESL
jgi:hypothetical protein